MFLIKFWYKQRMLCLLSNFFSIIYVQQFPVEISNMLYTSQHL